MVRATISEVKNGLIAYLRRVKSGEPVEAAPEIVKFLEAQIRPAQADV